LPDSDVTEVAPKHLAAAEEQLRDVAFVEISAAHATELTGQPFAPRAGSSLFLVRAVYLNHGTGRYTATPLRGELLVEHESLGRLAVPMKRSALVVRLSRRPKAVYVNCGMDE
jgi:hypothetical protein